MSKLHEKIQKLLNMANGSVQGNESELALKMAHDLMSANGISMADLDSEGRDEELGKLGEWNYGDKAYKSWEKTLAAAMAKLFDCQIVYTSQGNRKSAMNFIGREGNVRSAFAMNDWIHNKLWSDAKTKFGGREVAKCNSYCMGASQEIFNRVCEMKKNDAENGEGWGLVVVNEVTDFKNKLYPTLVSKSRKTTVGDWSAYTNGSSDGKNIGLNKQFGLRCIGA